MIVSFFNLDYNIINIHLQAFFYLSYENRVHQLLVCNISNIKVKKHGLKWLAHRSWTVHLEDSSLYGCIWSKFLKILRFYTRTPHISTSIYLIQGTSLRAYHVEINEVDTHSPFFNYLLYHHNICKSQKVFYFIDKV